MILILKPCKGHHGSEVASLVVMIQLDYYFHVCNLKWKTRTANIMQKLEKFWTKNEAIIAQITDYEL